MTDDERRELAKRYKEVRRAQIIKFNKSNFDGKVLGELFDLKNKIVKEFIEMYGEESSA